MSRGRKKRKGIESKTITENVWKREKGDNQEVAPRVCVCRAITGARVSHAQYEKKKRSGHWRFRASRVFCLLSRCQNPPWFFSANEEIDTIDFVSPLEQSALPLSSERWTAKERRPSRLTCSDQEGGVYDNELLTSARTDSEYLISSTNPPKKKEEERKSSIQVKWIKIGMTLSPTDEYCHQSNSGGDYYVRRLHVPSSITRQMGGSRRTIMYTHVSLKCRKGNNDEKVLKKILSNKQKRIFATKVLQVIIGRPVVHLRIVGRSILLLLLPALRLVLLMLLVTAVNGVAFLLVTVPLLGESAQL